MEQQMILLENATPEQQRAAALHFEILAAMESHVNTALELGRKLKQMRDGGGYRALGYETFEGYVRAAAGMGQRQAYNYINIAEKVPERLAAANADAGVTKLALLAQLGPRDQEELAGEGQLAGITVAELQELIDQKNGLAEQLSLMRGTVSAQDGPAAEVESAEVDLDEVRREAAEAARAEEAAKREQAVRDAVEDARRDAWEEAKAQAAGMRDQALAEAREAAAKAARSETEKLKKQLEDAEKRAREEAEAAKAEREKAVEAAKQAAFAEGQAAAGAAAERAEAERAEALARAEALQKQLDLAGDSETTRFLILFDQLQDTYRKMTGVLDGMVQAGKTEQADKLRGALGKALAAMNRK